MRQVRTVPFLGSRTEWMLGSTPPAAMVTLPSSLESSCVESLSAKHTKTQPAAWMRLVVADGELDVARHNAAKEELA